MACRLVLLYVEELYNTLNLQVPYFLLDLAVIQTYSNAIKHYIYRVSQEERTKLREGVPYVTLY